MTTTVKVLLFVQSGNGPIRLAERSRLSHEAMLGLVAELSPNTRWWLVECRNAEAGRILIALSQAVHAAYRYAGHTFPSSPFGSVVFRGDPPTGRILDFGSRDAIKPGDEVVVTKPISDMEKTLLGRGRILDSGSKDQKAGKP